MHYFLSFIGLIAALLALGFTWYFLVKEALQVIFWYGVPYVPSSDFKIEAFLDILETKGRKNFIDLGSWDGRVLEAVGKKYPSLWLYGIENSFFPYWLSLKRKKKNKLHYTVYKKNFFKEDLSRYDLIYSYTISYLMKKIWEKIKRECKPWTLFYSNAFELKWEKVLQKIPVSGKGFIYVYKV